MVSKREHKSGAHQRIPEVNFANVLMNVYIGETLAFFLPPIGPNEEI